MLLAGLIDGLQFARDGRELSGTIGPEGLPRLAELPCKTSGISYFLRGGSNSAGKPCIDIRAKGSLELVCQRCLEPLVFEADVDVSLELCGSLGEIAAAEDEVDRLLAGPEMSVAAMVEDEIMLVLPQVPRHENCGVEGLVAQPKRASPFGVLAALKKGGG